MAISNYLENKILEATLKGISYASPSVVYVCLYVSNPTDSDIGEEVSGAGYARQSVEFDNASDGSITNSSTVRFPIAEDAWGTINYIGIRDSLNGGNLLYYGMLSSSQSISLNNQLVINPGQLTITLD